MQQHKLLPAAGWIACLTIAAYVLAQAAAMIMSRGFDAAVPVNPAMIAQKPSESAAPPLPRLNPLGRNRSVRLRPPDHAKSACGLSQCAFAQRDAPIIKHALPLRDG